MKVIMAIVQNADRSRLTDALRRAKIRHTRLNTVGGFLSQGNTTFLIGVEDDIVQKALDIIRDHCQEREVLHQPTHGAMHPDAYASPTHVQVGGATVFVFSADGYRI